MKLKKNYTLSVFALAITFGLSGCATNEPTPEELVKYQKDCRNLQSKNSGAYIFANGECLKYKSFNGKKSDEINILIHGSWQRGQDPIGYRYSDLAESMAHSTSITSIALATPGYSGSTSNFYKDMSWKKGRVIPAEESFTKIMVSAIENLKKKYNAKKVNLFGKSSGAMIGGIISGYKPGLVDKYVLIGGAYNIYNTYRHNGWGKINPGLISSTNFVSKVKKDARFLIVAGENDDKASPLFAKNYVTYLNDEGIKADVLVIKGAGHSSLETNAEVLDATYTFFNN